MEWNYYYQNALVFLRGAKLPAHVNNITAAIAFQIIRKRLPSGKKEIRKWLSWSENAGYPGFTVGEQTFEHLRTFSKEDFISAFRNRPHAVVKFDVKTVPEVFLRELVNFHSELSKRLSFDAVCEYWRQFRRLPSWVFMTDAPVQLALNVAEAREKSTARHLMAEFARKNRLGEVYAISYDKTTDKQLAVVSTERKIKQFRRDIRSELMLGYVRHIEFFVFFPF